MKKFILIIPTLLILGLGWFSWNLLYTPETKPVASQTMVQYKPVVKVEPPTRSELLVLVNEERAKVNVAPLVIDERLNTSAQLKADDMNINNYFSHVDSNGKHGYEYIREQVPGLCVLSSENLRIQPIQTMTSSTTIKGWVKSDAHYKAMIDSRYNLTGFGISGKYVVEHFCQTR